MRAALGGIVCLVALSLAPGAGAAQRHSSPVGGGTACTAAAPCTIREAIGAAKSGDEVIVGTGTYSIGTEGLAPPDKVKDLYIHGAFDGPRPSIVATTELPALYAERSEFAYLEIVNDTPVVGIALRCSAGRIDRVRAVVNSIFGSAFFVGSGPCAISNSVAIATGAESRGLLLSGSDGASVIRNVTAIAAGTESVGIYARGEGGTHTVVLKNSIARGEVDLIADRDLSTAVTVATSNSNFVTQQERYGAKIIDEGGNQTAPPLFVNAALGDYRPAPGSPTIDAGGSDTAGALDPDGNARVLGAAPDIGAHEFVPPTVPLGPVPVPARILSLTISPARFKAANIGEAVLSAKKASNAPVSATVTYSLSAQSSVTFEVEKLAKGRKAGKRCVKQTKANKGKKKCDLVKPVSGSFTHTGVAGANSFKFSARLGNKALRPGRYRLVGSAGGVKKIALFKVLK